MLQASHKSFDPCPQNFRDFEASSVVMARGVGSVSSVTWLVEAGAEAGAEAWYGRV